MDMETLTVFRYTITFLALFFWVTTYYGIITGAASWPVFAGLAVVYTIILGIVW